MYRFMCVICRCIDLLYACYWFVCRICVLVLFMLFPLFVCCASASPGADGRLLFVSSASNLKRFIVHIYREREKERER